MTRFPLLAITLLVVTQAIVPPLAAQPLELPRTLGKPDRPGDPRQPIWRALNEALDRNDLTAARQHLLNALWCQPFDVDVLELSLRVAGDDDERQLWARRLADAASDSKGSLPRPITKLLGDDADPLASVTRAREAALEELLSKIDRTLSSKEIGAAIVANQLGNLAIEITSGAPALHAEAKPTLDRVAEPQRNPHVEVVKGLIRLMKHALSNGDVGTAIRAARSLKGIARQGAFKDLKGPKPSNLESAEDAANDGLERARALLAAESEPLTVDQLEAMDPQEAIEFTRHHSDFDRPGIALSPNGRYRIETICGYDTLLGAARSVEQHHARLVDWFGKDPFQDRIGVVRIVPEASGLEAEGAPYFWVGGFQSGDITTLRFNASNIASLGRGLTHELTHRFDGAIYSGLPAWLVEGRAVYTGGAYGLTSETSFIPNHANFGTLESAMRKGYGGLDKLTELLDGTIEDYRDNYVAGYALFVYLNSWEEEGSRPYQALLDRYMSTIRKGRSKPSRYFESIFCDGKQGRPKDLKGFAESFSTFLSGFYWLDRKPWTSRYTEKVTPEPSPTVFDSPTWGFRRNRSEPWFGDEQAAIAGELLHEAGKEKEAAIALAWAIRVDEWSTSRALLLANLLEEERETIGAWVLRAESWRRQPNQQPSPGRWPMLNQLPKTMFFLSLLADQSRALAAADLPRTAAAIAADHDRYAAMVGVDPIRSKDDVARRTPPKDGASGAPFSAPPFYAGMLDWFESDLSGFEEYRVENLWYEDGAGGLHVGRKEPRDKTGELDRSAHRQHAYARSGVWIPPGRYRVTARIQFTTSYVDGAMVIGQTRRDRNLRLRFNAGDYMYSIGQRDEASKLESVNVSFTGLRDGESPWTGQESARNVKFDNPKTSFVVELLIDGPLAIASVEGSTIGTYRTVDGQPIEGFVGFASSFGAFRADRPTIEPLHRAAQAGDVCEEALGLTLAKDGPIAFDKIRNRSATGLQTSPRGSVVVWVPWPKANEDWEVEEGEDAFDLDQLASKGAQSTRAASDLLWRAGFDVPVTLVTPSLFQEAQQTSIERELNRSPKTPCIRAVHHKEESLFERPKGEEEKEDLSQVPALLFIDPSGVVRAGAPFSGGGLPGALHYWLSIHRARGPSESEKGE